MVKIDKITFENTRKLFKTRYNKIELLNGSLQLRQLYMNNFIIVDKIKIEVLTDYINFRFINIINNEENQISDLMLKYDFISSIEKNNNNIIIELKHLRGLF